MIEWRCEFSTGELETTINHANNAVGLAKAQAVERLSSCPEINVRSKFYWNAFQELKSDRPTGDELGRIPFSSLLAYCNEYRIDGEERENFKRIIRHIDNIEVSLTNERLAKEAKAAAKSK